MYEEIRTYPDTFYNFIRMLMSTFDSLLTYCQAMPTNYEYQHEDAALVLFSKMQLSATKQCYVCTV